MATKIPEHFPIKGKQRRLKIDDKVRVAAPLDLPIFLTPKDDVALIKTAKRKGVVKPLGNILKRQRCLPAESSELKKDDSSGPLPFSTPGSSNGKTLDKKVGIVKPSRENTYASEQATLWHDPKESVRAKTPLLTPLRVVLEAQPAYQRFKDLVTPSGTQILPKTYSTLEKMFNSLETVINFMNGRRDPSIFHRIKKSVENLCNRNFELTSLQQIVTVFPEAYKLSPIRTIINGAKVESLLLVIPSGGFGSIHEEAAFTASNSIIRRKKFRNSLLDLVFISHDKYTKSLGFDLKCENRSELQQYHKDFNLDEHVDPISLSKLPSFEPTDRKPSQRLSLCFDKAEPKAIAPIVEVALVIPSTSSTPVETSAVPLSRYEALKKRLQEKERKSIELAMVKPPKSRAQIHSNALVSRYPAMARCIFLYFTGQKKQGIVIGQVVETLVNSHKTGISSEDAYRCVRHIAEIAPQWLTIITLADGRDIVKIDRKVDMKGILSQMEQALDK